MRMSRPLRFYRLISSVNRNAIFLSLLLRGCGTAAGASGRMPPHAPPPSNVCMSAVADRQNATLFTRAGNLRAAAAVWSESEAACPDGARWGEFAAVLGGLGRTEELARLRAAATGRRDVPEGVRAALDEALARATAQVHGLETGQQLVEQALASPEPRNGPETRALLDRALDELERASGQAVEPVDVALNAAATVQFSPRARWVGLVDSGPILDLKTHRIFDIAGSWIVDPTDSWLWATTPPNGRDSVGMSLIDLEHGSKLIANRALVEAAQFAADGVHCAWTEPPATVHLVDLRNMRERTFLSDPKLAQRFGADWRRNPASFAVNSSGRIRAWISATDSQDTIHFHDVARDHEASTVEPGRHVSSAALSDSGVLVAAWEGAEIVAVRASDGATIARLTGVDAVSVGIDDNAGALAWIDVPNTHVGFYDFVTRRKAIFPSVPSGTPYGMLSSCGGGLPSTILSTDSRGALVRCESGDVGGTLAYDRHTGHVATVSSWSPGDDVAAENETSRLCALTGADCSDCGYRCSSATKLGTYVRLQNGIVRVDPVTGKRNGALVESASQRIEVVETSRDGALLAGVGSDEILRVWDARSGELVWRMESMGKWCKLGMRLYPRKLCSGE